MEKEKQVILKEINMVTDDPRQHQWILFQKEVFDKHPAKNPTYGTVKAVKAVSRKTLVDYYRKHYCANNMIVTISGNVGNIKGKVEQYFGKIKSKKTNPRKIVNEPLSRKTKKFVEKRVTKNSYMVLGYRTVSRLHRDSYALDVIQGILGRGQSGWMFNEIRNKRGLAYQVGLMLEHEKDYGFFAVFCGLHKNKIEEAKKIILEQFKKLQKIDGKILNESKTFIEGSFTLQMEDNFSVSDSNGYWETIKDAKLGDNYVNNIKKVSLKDVKKAAKKYLNDKYTLVVIEQK